MVVRLNYCLVTLIRWCGRTRLLRLIRRRRSVGILIGRRILHIRLKMSIGRRGNTFPVRSSGRVPLRCRRVVLNRRPQMSLLMARIWWVPRRRVVLLLLRCRLLELLRRLLVTRRVRLSRRRTRRVLRIMVNRRLRASRSSRKNIVGVVPRRGRRTR